MYVCRALRSFGKGARRRSDKINYGSVAPSSARAGTRVTS